MAAHNETVNAASPAHAEVQPEPHGWNPWCGASPSGLRCCQERDAAEDRRQARSGVGERVAWGANGCGQGPAHPGSPSEACSECSAEKGKV
jgi:hypothetical protein